MAQENFVMERFRLVDGVRVPFTEAEELARDADEAAWAADTLRREAQGVLEAWDAKGFTRAWESTMAPIEAAGNVSEYDANVLEEKRAARAVVVA